MLPERAPWALQKQRSPQTAQAAASVLPAPGRRRPAVGQAGPALHRGGGGAAEAAGQPGPLVLVCWDAHSSWTPLPTGGPKTGPRASLLVCGHSALFCVRCGVWAGPCGRLSCGGVHAGRRLCPSPDARRPAAAQAGAWGSAFKSEVSAAPAVRSPEVGSSSVGGAVGEGGAVGPGTPGVAGLTPHLPPAGSLRGQALPAMARSWRGGGGGG